MTNYVRFFHLETHHWSFLGIETLVTVMMLLLFVLLQLVQSKPGRQLVIVRYRPEHFWGYSWINNGYDIPTQHVICARYGARGVESIAIVRVQRSPGAAACSTGEGVHTAARQDSPLELCCGRRAVFAAVSCCSVYGVLFGINRAVVRSAEIAVKISLSEVTGWPATQILPDPLWWKSE